jgi:RimJ/RimL family protein N-acetyltransferase
MDSSQYSASETLRDGRVLQIRALKPSDREQLAVALRRMSDESIYRRFFSPKQRFTDQEISYYLNVDFVNHVAMVALLEEQGSSTVVGGARYVVAKPGVAEVAFAVDDPHQGFGIGARLMKHLTLLARGAGLKEFFAEVLPGNTAMLKVFEKSGLKVDSKREDGVVHVTLSLA